MDGRGNRRVEPAKRKQTCCGLIGDLLGPCTALERLPFSPPGDLTWQAWRKSSRAALCWLRDPMTQEEKGGTLAAPAWSCALNGDARGGRVSLNINSLLRLPER